VKSARRSERAMRITINGREYNSVEEMPADIRKQYQEAMSMLADKDGSGVPDIFERGDVSMSSDGQRKVVTSVKTESRFVINGREYDRSDDVPPELQALLGQTAKRRGVKIRITSATVLAILAASAITLLIAWLALR